MDLSEESINWDIINLTTSGQLTGEKLKKAYDEWSQKYNQDYEGASYNGPAMGAEKFAEMVEDKDCRILDVGCGTGRVGEELTKRGFTNIHGVDFSEKCIEVAMESGFYRSIECADIVKNGLPANNNEYDSVITVGTFVPGHLQPSCLSEFCRVVKPGGYVVVAMRESYLFNSPDFNNFKLESEMVKMSELGSWNYLRRERLPHFCIDHAGIIFVFQVN